MKNKYIYIHIMCVCVCVFYCRQEPIYFFREHSVLLQIGTNVLFSRTHFFLIFQTQKNVKVMQIADYIRLKQKIYHQARSLTILKQHLLECQERLRFVRMEKTRLTEQIKDLQSFVGQELSDTVIFNHPEQQQQSQHV